MGIIAYIEHKVCRVDQHKCPFGSGSWNPTVQTSVSSARGVREGWRTVKCTEWHPMSPP